MPLTHKILHSQYGKPQVPEAAFLGCHDITVLIRTPPHTPANGVPLPLPTDDGHMYQIMSSTLQGVAVGLTKKAIKYPKTRNLGNVNQYNNVSLYTPTTTYVDAAIFMLHATKDSSPFKGKLCIFDPATNNFTSGTPFLDITSGGRNRTLDIAMKLDIIKSNGSLSAPRPHQQAHNAIQDFVMAAYTASVAGIEAPPLKPTSQQLASYAGQLEDVFALAFMQILDIGGTTAFLKEDAGEYDCERAQLDTPPPIKHIWGRPPQMHCATKQIKITSTCMMYHPFMLMYNTTYSPNSTWEKAHTKHIISPHTPTQPWYKAPHPGTVTNTYFTPPPPTMAVPPTAATLGRKYDPNAFIMQPNNTIMNDILDDTGGVITLRYRDENLGTTVMELTLSQLPPAASATNSDDMDTNLTSILMLNTSTHIILSPIVKNTSVTGTQLMNALRTVMNLAQRMMDGSAGSQTDMLPPFSVRDRLT